MTIGCNIWMICLKLNWFFYGLNRMLQFSQFVWTLSYSVWDVFNNFLLIYATDRSKISSDDQKRFFIALSLYPITLFANTPFNLTLCKMQPIMECWLQKLISQSRAEKLARYEWESSNWSEPSRDIQKRGLRRKSKVFTVDIHNDYQSGFRVSKTIVFNWEVIK